MSNDKQIHAKLKAAQKAWSTSEEKRPDAPLDDGEYIAKPDEMRIDVSKSGRLQCVTKWAVTQGPDKGGSIRRYDGLDDEVGMSYFKGYAAIIGLEVPESMADLPEAVEDFVDNNSDEFKMVVRTQKDGDFKNVYINGLADGSEELEQEGEKPKNKKSTSKKKDLEEETPPEKEEFVFEEGQVVEITLKSGKSVEGSVVEVTETTVTVEADDDEQYEIKLARIDSVEERKKTKTTKKK